MDERLKKLKLNSILSLGYQLILIISGLILPRYFLSYYGSDVYGLVSSISQFLSFVNICDMGIGAVVSSALYKPLAENDNEKISVILATAKHFFRVVSFFLVIYVIILCFIFPIKVANSFDTFFTISLLLSMSVSIFGQYFIGISYQILLNSDQKYYVQLIINGVTLVLNTIFCIILITLGCSIQVVKLVTSIIYLLRPIILFIYTKKKYSFNKKAKCNWNVIPQKFNGIFQHISYTVCENTDIAILTLFSSLANVAIYSVYYLIVNCIKNIIKAMTSSIVATFGNMIANNEKKRLIETYDLYEWFVHTLGSLLFTITGVLILAFVSIYTRGVNDANYNVPIFAILMVVVAFFNIVRASMYNVIMAAGHYKQTQFACACEMLINIFVSITLVFKFGLIGVAIGTIASTLFFIIYEVIYLSKNILNRSINNFIKQGIIDLIFILITIIATFLIPINNNNYIYWIFSAIIVSLISLVICVIINLIFYRKNIMDFIKFVLKK